MTGKHCLKPEPWTSAIPEGRWAPLGPYYAMFPVDFVRRAVNAFSKPGDGVLDPFCGRGTVPFVASVTGRSSVGVDVNPVAFVYASAKTSPEPEVNALLARIDEIREAVTPDDAIPENEFQEWAWNPQALGFLRSARRGLRWHTDRADRTLAAILLVHLHGKTGNAISNQMRQSKAMAPDYSVRWWKEREMRPPPLDPAGYLKQKVQWRYAKGIPNARLWSEIALGDARLELPSWRRSSLKLLLTSPPYCGVTNYRVDNWIRLWLLGGAPLPDWRVASRYSDRNGYRRLLMESFEAARAALADDAVVLVRTDSRVFTRDATAATLRALWPDRTLLAKVERPAKTQTRLFGDRGEKPGETDLLLLPPGTKARITGYRMVADRAMCTVPAWKSAQPSTQGLADAS